MSISKGLLSSLNVAFNGDDCHYLQTDASCSQGCSGGPIFNNNGEVIGMIKQQRRNNDGTINENYSYAFYSTILTSTI